jgi:hypothetical protein
MTDVFIKINPTDPLRLGKETERSCQRQPHLVFYVHPVGYGTSFSVLSTSCGLWKQKNQCERVYLEENKKRKKTTEHRRKKTRGGTKSGLGHLQIEWYRNLHDRSFCQNQPQ